MNLAENDKNNWLSQIRTSLNALALDPEEQAKFIGPGCVACELVTDFETASLLLDQLTDHPEGMKGFFNQIKRLIEEMDEPDYECFNNDVLSREKWQQIRIIAKDASKAWGWGIVTNIASEQIAKDVWGTRNLKP